MASLTTSAPCGVCAAARERLVDAEIETAAWKDVVAQFADFEERPRLTVTDKRAMKAALKELAAAEQALDAVEAQCPNHTLKGAL